MKDQALSMIPEWVYYGVGLLVVCNLGTIFSVIWFGIKMSWTLSAKFSKLESGIDSTDKKSDLAHKRIDKIENKVWQ